MESQLTKKNLRINKNKTIGKVIIIVEGESEEFKLLKHIFTNILDYTYIPLKRGKNKLVKDIIQSKINKNNTVIVVNSDNSNIKSIHNDKEYRNKLTTLLQSELNQSIKNSYIYFLWDKDKGSNKEDIILDALKTYGNSLENENAEMNGLLLLSYPCIESYEISNFDKNLWKKSFSTSEEAKKFKKEKRYSTSLITEETLLTAIYNMHNSFLTFGITEYDLDNFQNINIRLFYKQLETYKQTKQYKALSLISIMLLDLGIITKE